MRHHKSAPGPNVDEFRRFFAWSDFLDREVLRPLSHINSAWEATWDVSQKRYIPEEHSFAEQLNQLIDDIATTAPPKQYHDNEDVLANYVLARLKWQMRKEGGRWVGADYESILERGGFQDVDQDELLSAATGSTQLSGLVKLTMTKWKARIVRCSALFVRAHDPNWHDGLVTGGVVQPAFAQWLTSEAYKCRSPD